MRSESPIACAPQPVTKGRPEVTDIASSETFNLGQLDEAFPAPDGSPIDHPEGKFWLSRTEDGSILAIYKVCTHLGCLYNWQQQEHKFICPCHGSQFQLDGTTIQGPAPRSLDRFVVRLLDDAGEPVAVTDEQGNAIPLPEGGLQVLIETGQLVRGKPSGENYPTSEKS